MRFGGGVGQTIISPIVLIAVLIAGLLICFGSRRKALVAFLSGAMLIPVDQVLLIGSLHFPMLRVLILFAGIRMLREKFSGAKLLGAGWNRIDPAIIVLTLFIAVNGVLLYGTEQAVVLYQLGNIYSAFGAYFLLRFLVRDDTDVMLAVRTFACVAMIVAVIMTYEQATGKNPYYAYLGGAHASMYGSALERGERFRATGCFGHPILAGTFGAISLPLFAGLGWRSLKYRWVAVMGMLSAAIIAWAANSSTALVGFAAGVGALCLWPLRKYMRPIRWAIVLVLLNVQLAMSAPLWRLITRIDVTGSSSSYHRYQLINQCILHFNDWWLIGTKNYADWGWDMWDLSNQYVGIADVSGLIPLLAFLAMIAFAFKYVGKARRFAPDKNQEWFVWALGSSLFANVVAFFGIGYFDQTIVAWYALLAMIPVTAHSLRKARQAELEKSAAQELAQPLIEGQPEIAQIPHFV